MSVMEKLRKFGARTVIKIKDKSPEILIAVGVGSFIGSTVLACRATTKMALIKERYIEDMNNCDRCLEMSVELNDGIYNEEEMKQDKAILTIQHCVEYVKAYAPSVALGIVGLGCIIKSRNIMQNRNFAIATAYNLISQGFNAYRSRVRQELGEDQDLHFRYGARMEEETTVTTDENGKKVKTKEVKTVLDQKIDPAVYSREFDSKIRNWSNCDDYNWVFLRSKQDYFNWLLQKDGVVFLNDVYKELGYDITYDGQEIGWTDDGGDGIVSFGIKPMKRLGSEASNAVAKAMLLEFNVEGPVRYKLKSKRNG